MKKIKLLATCFSLIVVNLMTVQAADKALINTLVQKGYLTTQEAKNLSMTSNHREGDRGDVFGEQPNTNSIAIGGSAHVRYQYSDPKLNNRGTGAELGRSSSFLVRKAKLGMKASVWEDWRIEVTSDYNEARTSIDTALISYDYMEELSMDFGYGPTPSGFEATQSTTKVKSMERSIANQYFGSQLGFGYSHVGIFLKGSNVADLEGWTYAMALTRADNGITHPQDTITKESTPRQSYPAFFMSSGYKFAYDDVHFDLWGNFNYQRNQRPIVSAATATAGNEKTNDFLASFAVNTQWEDFTLLTEFYGASLDKGKINSITDKSRAKPAGLTIMPSYMHDDQWEFVFTYSLIRAKDASLTNIGTGRTSQTVNGRGVNLKKVSNNFLTQLSDGFSGNNTGYNNVSSYAFNVNYFPIKGERQLKLAAGYEFIKARNASVKGENGAAAHTNSIADTNVNAHLVRADVRMVF